jgi:hypothetical protein
MTVASSQLNAQTKETTVKSPAELRSDRELKITATMEQVTQGHCYAHAEPNPYRKNGL